MMRGLGFEPHVWQQLRADVSYELVPAKGGGMRLAARVGGTMVGRQSGKTASAAGDIMLRGLAPSLPQVVEFVGHPIGPQHVAFTAQDRNSALDQWDEHVEMIMASDLARYVAQGGPQERRGMRALRERVHVPDRHPVQDGGPRHVARFGGDRRSVDA